MSTEGMGGPNVTDIRRERIPLLWSTVGESAGQRFCFQQRDCKVSMSLQKNKAVWKICKQ